MKIRRYNIILKKVIEMEIPITPEELERIERKEDHIQRIVPHLSADHREFILSGLLPEQWDEMFPDI